MSFPFLAFGQIVQRVMDRRNRVKEYADKYDLLWTHFTDDERNELGVYLWDYDEWRYPETLQEFREKFNKEDISWRCV